MGATHCRREATARFASECLRSPPHRRRAREERRHVTGKSAANCGHDEDETTCSAPAVRNGAELLLEIVVIVRWRTGRADPLQVGNRRASCLGVPGVCPASQAAGSDLFDDEQKSRPAWPAPRSTARSAGRVSTVARTAWCWKRALRAECRLLIRRARGSIRSHWYPAPWRSR